MSGEFHPTKTPVKISAGSETTFIQTLQLFLVFSGDQPALMSLLRPFNLFLFHDTCANPQETCVNGHKNARPVVGLKSTLPRSSCTGRNGVTLWIPSHTHVSVWQQSDSLLRNSEHYPTLFLKASKDASGGAGTFIV